MSVPLFGRVQAVTDINGVVQVVIEKADNYYVQFSGVVRVPSYAKPNVGDMVSLEFINKSEGTE